MILTLPAESPFETVPPLPLDDCWVDLHFVDLQEHALVQLYGSLAESRERRYRERSIVPFRRSSSWKVCTI